MKFKILLQLALLAVGGSGCCTYMLVSSTHYTTRDVFRPAAVYVNTNLDTLAFEGVRYNDATDYGLSRSNRVFVILPREQGAIPFNSHWDAPLSADDVQRLLPNYPGYMEKLKTSARQPAGFHKVADAPPNDVNLVVQEHHPRRIRYVFAPFTLAADVATSPIQLACLGVIWWETK